MNSSFTPEGWDDFQYWLSKKDIKIISKIANLIKDIKRNGHEGIGHPEQLGSNLSGWWSRRIDEKNRLVYKIIDSNTIEISQCKGHYDDK